VIQEEIFKIFEELAYFRINWLLARARRLL